MKTGRTAVLNKQSLIIGNDDILSLTSIDGELLTPRRQIILSLDVKTLSLELKTGKLSPLEVLEAYQAKALAVDKDLNAVCDFILEAREWAEELSKLEEEKRGALFGIPVSIKECFYVKGYDATVGLAKFIGQPAEEDGELVKALKELHAVPFCLTNLPQTMVSVSCSNPVYGNTRNPHDLSRTSGGSSGGEGALIAAGASILGISWTSYCSAPNLAQTPAELCQMSSCSGEHYNPSPYYYSLLYSTLPTLLAIAIYSPGQQKKFNYSAPIRDIELKFWG